MFRESEHGLKVVIVFDTLACVFDAVYYIKYKKRKYLSDVFNINIVLLVDVMNWNYIFEYKSEVSNPVLILHFAGNVWVANIYLVTSERWEGLFMTLN